MTNIYNRVIEKYGENSTEAKTTMQELQKKARDNGRTPIQWDDSPNAGFSTGIPWMRVNSDYKEWNAATQIPDPSSVFNFYRKILNLRKEYRDLFIYGSFQLLLESDEKLFVYKRTYRQDSAVIATNFSDKPVEVDVSAFGGSLKTVILSNQEKGLDVVGKETLTLRPYEAFVALLV